MAENKKRGRPFAKGNKANPGGRPKKDPIIKAFQETTYKEFIDGLQRYGKLTRTEMAVELSRPDATMFEIMFGQIVASAAKGDKDARQLLLDRLWGKVKNEVEIDASIKMNPLKEEMKTKSTDELLEIVSKAKIDE